MARESSQDAWLRHQVVADVVQAAICCYRPGHSLPPASHILGTGESDAPRSAVAIGGPVRRRTGAPSTDLRLVY
jgi:hypothetical protein